MAAASYQLYPPVIVVFVYPHRRGEAVGGWDWGEMAGETRCIRHDWEDILIVARHCWTENVDHGQNPFLGGLLVLWLSKSSMTLPWPNDFQGWLDLGVGSTRESPYITKCPNTVNLYHNEK
jgi:hypothetical protein